MQIIKYKMIITADIVFMETFFYLSFFFFSFCFNVRKKGLKCICKFLSFSFLSVRSSFRFFPTFFVLFFIFAQFVQYFQSSHERVINFVQINDSMMLSLFCYSMKLIHASAVTITDFHL